MIGCVEIWMKEEDWEKIKGRMPREFKWWIQSARSKGKKRKTINKIWIGERKKLEGKSERVDEERLIIREISWEKKSGKLEWLGYNGQYRLK